MYMNSTNKDGLQKTSPEGELNLFLFIFLNVDLPEKILQYLQLFISH